FFFQAEDGIRDRNVTGVQTCALPIFLREARRRRLHFDTGHCEDASARAVQRAPALAEVIGAVDADRRGREHHRRAIGGRGRRQQIGRASCRERGERAGGGGGVKRRAA